MDYDITTIICYCSHDYRYIKKCIDEALVFSKEVIVVVCDHFFNGEKENHALLIQTYNENPKAQFLQFAYDEDKLYLPFWDYDSHDDEWVYLWHATARYVGYLYAKSEYLLFLDCDEIVDGRLFARWLKTNNYVDYNVCRFSSYCYFYRADLQSEEFFHSALITRKDQLNESLIVNPYERYGIFMKMPGAKKSGILSDEGNPMFHHYSWVKSKEEALNKAKRWGHQKAKEWEKEIERFFSGPKERDFIFQKKLQMVDPFFDPMKISVAKLCRKKPNNVIYLNRKNVMAKSLKKI